MRFKFEIEGNCPTGSMLVYRSEEFSFDVEPGENFGLTSLVINDLNLELDRNGKVISVWGVCPHTRWVETSLSVPRASFGDVYFICENPLIAGVSIRYTDPGDYFPVYVDWKCNWVKIEAPVEPALAINIMRGVVIELSAEGDFSALWLSPARGMEAIRPKS